MPPRKKPASPVSPAETKPAPATKPAAKKAPAAKKPAAPRKKPTSDIPAKRRPTAPPTEQEDFGPDDGTGRSLVIVESPSKAKTIAKYLGSNFKVLASYGHVRDLPSKGKTRDEEVVGINIAGGWLPRYVVEDRREGGASSKRRSPRDILDELGREARKASRIYLATDPDREGEAIAWHILDELKLPEAKTYRIRFNEITRPAIQAALAAADKIDMSRVNAQETRRILDRVVGYPLSNLLSKKVTAGLSAGRVQSVAVRIVVDRELEIEAFKTEEYWRIRALLALPDTVKYTADPTKAKVYAKKKGAAGDAAETPEEGETTAEGTPTKKEETAKIPAGSFIAELHRWQDAEFACADEATADAIYAQLNSATYKVRKIDQRDRKEYPQAPFTTSTLQQQANIRLHFTTQQTMSTAQKLYEGVDCGSDGTVALITYMRTDSTRVSNDALTAVRSMIQSDFGPNYLPPKPNSYASGKSAQEAHEAVRPTNLEMTPARVQPHLAPPQYRLYKLIYDRFVASQMMPAVFAVTSVEIEAGQGIFKANGRIEKFDGYRKVMPVIGREDVTLPPLREAQTLAKLSLASSQHFTQPPPRYNEASLVKKLEEEGIGRPSTYSSIIQTIQKRGYVEQDARRFKATELGKVATDFLVKGFPKVVDVKFTSQIEAELDQVEMGQAEANTILTDFWQNFSTALTHAKDHMPAAKGVETGEMCPKCGRPLVEQYSAKTKSKFIGCSGYRDKENKCDYIKPREGQPEPAAPVLTDFACPRCGKPFMQLTGRNGVYFKCSGAPGCKTVANPDAEGKPIVSAMETEHTCGKCGAPMVLRNFKGKFFMGCSAYPKCKNTIQCDAEGKPIEPVVTGEVCEKCNAPMDLKNYRGRFFLGCSAYPKCRSTKPLTEELKEKLKDQIAASKPAAKTAAKAGPEIEITELCPLCEAPMKLARGPRGFFLGCTAWAKTKCKGTRKITPELQAKIDAVKEQPAEA